jgi:hypothetical protein
MVEDTRFARVRGVRTASMQLRGIALRGASACAVLDASGMSSGQHGLSVEDSNMGGSVDNVVVGLTVAGNGYQINSGTAGLLVQNATGNVFSRVTAAHNQPYGVNSYLGAIGNTFAHLTLASNLYSGIDIFDTGNVVAQVVAVNHPQGPAVRLELDARAAGLIAANNDVGVQSDATTVAVSSVLQVGGNTMDCRVFDGTTYANNCGAFGPAVVVEPGRDLTSSFRGIVTADGANASDTAGLANRTAITDWFHFDNATRAWGIDGPFPGSSGFCTDACRIWDWHRADSDVILTPRDASGAVDDQPLVPGAPCPTRFDGDHAVADATGSYFLLDATELIGDGKGDDDGLCESTETCIEIRSLGAERDEPSAWTSVGCVFKDGLVNGVDLRGIP